MLLIVSSVKLVAEIALMALAGQFVLGLLAGARRDDNFFYRLLQVLTNPFVRGVRRITPRGRMVQPRLPARRRQSARRSRARVSPGAGARPPARPRLVRPGPHADPPAPLRRSRGRAEAQHRAPTDEPVRLVPAGAGAHGSPRARRDAPDHSPPAGLRAQGGGATGARDRVGAMTGISRKAGRSTQTGQGRVEGTGAIPGVQRWRQLRCN